MAQELAFEELVHCPARDESSCQSNREPTFPAKSDAFVVNLMLLLYKKEKIFIRNEFTLAEGIIESTYW